MKYAVFLLIVLFSCFSCNSKNNTNLVETSASYRPISFEKLDSIRIDYLGVPLVQDIDPLSQTVLFMDNLQNTADITLADFGGNVINSFSKFGDMPDAYGLRMAPLRLLDGKRFMVYGSNGFMTYNFEADLLSRIKLVEFEMPGRTGGGMKDGMEKSQNRYLIANHEYPPNKDYKDIKVYENLFILDWLYPETGKKEPFIQFPETSIFKSGKHFFRSAWDPAFVMADNHIYVVFGLEPVIYMFEDSAPYSLVSSIPLDLPKYRYFKGTDSFTDEGNTLLLRITSAFIENIKKVEGYFLVAYFPGYDDADLETFYSNKTQEETAAFNAKMKQKYPHRIAVLDSTGRVINDFVPDGLVAYSMLVRNGELWMQEKPNEEVEEDYFRLFRVGLKFD